MQKLRDAACWTVAILLAGLLSACGGGSGTGSASLAAATKALTPAGVMPQDGLWWNPSESGRGYTLELQGNLLVLTLYMYEANGAPVWYSGPLTQQPDGAYTGTVLRFAGGQSLAGAYKAPTGNTAVANVSLGFFSATSGSLTLVPAGGATHTVPIQKFTLGGSGPAPGFQNGIWWNSAESGRGFFVETLGGQVTIGAYMYDGGGQPIWYTAVAPLQADGLTATGALQQFAGGQTLGGAYKAPAPSASPGTVTFAASNGNTAQLTLPNGTKVPLQRFQFAGTAPAGTDLASLATANITPRLSIAGTWVPMDDPKKLLIPFWGNVRIGTEQLEGVAMAGWSITPGGNPTAITPTRAVVLRQQDNGLLADATAAVLGNATINGAGSVLAADFNGDGRDDLIFPVHNEHPFACAPSTAFMSRADGGFDRIVLPDGAMNHDAQVVVLGGQKRILTRSFGGSAPGCNYTNYLYTWTGSNFAVQDIGDTGNMSVSAGKYGNDGEDWIAIAGTSFGADLQSWTPTSPMLNYVFRFNGGIVKPGTPLPKPYFNDKPEYAGFQSGFVSLSHMSRISTTDLNQDGRPDLIANTEIWSSGAGLQRTVLQLLVNQGNATFQDQTDALAPEYDKQSNYIDYSLRLVDLDGSGIASILMVNAPGNNPSLTKPSGNFLLVNDGTGRLYAALGTAEFAGMAAKVTAYTQTQVGNNRFVSTWVPGFLPYRTPNGLLNYVAIVPTTNTTNPPGFAGYSFVNIPLQINLATDFRRNLTIPTRNGSRNIRTFAGNDAIHRAVSDPDAKIDGGLGVNTAVYPGPRSAWTITRAGASFTVRPSAGAGGTDTLTRIQKAQFDDQTVELALVP